MPQNNIILDTTEITGEAELERLLAKLHIPPHKITPSPDRDYANISAAFIRRLGETANALNLAQHLDRPADNTTGNSYLTFHKWDAFLIIQYFEEGCALIGYCHAYYGRICYYVNDYDNWNALQRVADSDHTVSQRALTLLGKQMLCCDGSIIRNIILHFCRTGHETQNHPWIEDFSYTGPDNWHRDWLKSSLLGNFSLEERQPELIRLRAAQEEGKWQWGSPWPFAESKSEQIHWENSDEMDYLAKLASTKVPASKELDKHEKLLRKTARRLQREESFTQRESGVRNLSFLQNCQKLHTLDLRCNDVEDLTPIASLTDLKELNLDFNRIADLSPLSGLMQLRKLWLRGNRISSLEPLQDLENLRNLHLRNNPLAPESLLFLHQCKRLDILDLSYTGIQDLSGLKGCRATILDCYGNPDLTGLEVITTMRRLTHLSLDLEVAMRYDIPALMPRFTEHARYGNHVLYVWPEKYFD